MIYQEFITKNHLWKAYYKYRCKHLDISYNRSLRSFCMKHGFLIANYHRKHNAWLKYAIDVAKVNFYELR